MRRTTIGSAGVKRETGPTAGAISLLLAFVLIAVVAGTRLGSIDSLGADDHQLISDPAVPDANLDITNLRSGSCP